MNDPLTRLAKLRIVKLSQNLEVILATKQGGDVVNEIVNRLRDRAAESMTALIVCNATDTNEVLRLQNEVIRYDEFVRTLSEIVTEGIQYDGEISREDREDLLDILSTTVEGQREAVALGLVPEDMQ